MALLDPFYSVSYRGTKITKWMNRITLLSEVSYVCYCGYFFCLGYGQVPWWIFPTGIFVGIILIAIANWLLRMFWNVIIVIIYGTTNEQVIARDFELKAEREEQRQLKNRNRYLAKLEKENSYKVLPVEVESGKIA